MKYDFLKDMVVTGLEGCAATFTEKGAAKIHRRRGLWLLSLKYTGETVYTCNGKQIVNDLNNAVLLPDGCDYSWRCTEEGYFIFIQFASNLTFSEIIPVPLSDGKALLKRMQEYHTIYTSRQPFYRMHCTAELCSMLQSMLQPLTQGYTLSVKQKKIQPAMDYIISHYTQPITNDELAAQTPYSTMYFRKLFKEVYGTSPIAYIQSLRILQAKEMLRVDYGSISTVALSLGYANIYDFSRAFKKETGMPPSEYAKRLAAPEKP